MRNPALPATHTDEGDLITDIDPEMLKCVGCKRSIMSTSQCVYVKRSFYCGEVCASLHAIARLRAIK